MPKTPTSIEKFDPTNKEQMLRLCHSFDSAVQKFFGVKLTREERRIAKQLLYRIFLRKRHTIVLSICRQVGKTEVVCFVVWFLAYIFPNLAGEKFRCIITAPERTTGSEVFDRTKRFFDQCEVKHPEKFSFEQKSLDVIALPDGSKIDIFGLFKGFARREEKKTTKEGRACHLLIRDEMHLGDDQIFRDELEPALSTTGGIDVWIGNGGYRQCRAKDLCDMTNTPDVTVIKKDFAYMKEAMREENERTGNPMFLRWIESQEKYIADYGIESDEVQKNLFLKWIVEIGNFISWEHLIGHRRMIESGFLSSIADVGIDFAKEHDETILTITDYERNIRDWQVFRGEYTDQVDSIATYLQSAGEVHGVTLRFGFCDSTGVGDPLKSMLRKRLRMPLYGIVFSAQTKDILGKKMLNAFQAKDERHRLSYPFDHPLRPKFEDQFRKLLKERRETGQLNYRHPDEHNAHDDYCDSLALSLWRIERVMGAEQVVTDEPA